MSALCIVFLYIGPVVLLLFRSAAKDSLAAVVVISHAKGKQDHIVLQTKTPIVLASYPDSVGPYRCSLCPTLTLNLTLSNPNPKS